MSFAEQVQRVPTQRLRLFFSAIAGTLVGRGEFPKKDRHGKATLDRRIAEEGQRRGDWKC